MKDTPQNNALMTQLANTIEHASDCTRAAKFSHQRHEWDKIKNLNNLLRHDLEQIDKLTEMLKEKG